MTRQRAVGIVLAAVLAAAVAVVSGPSARGTTGSAGSPAVVLPRPDHVVVVVLENHSYAEILGGTAAPYLASLAAGGASFTQSFGVTHPSQPNYLALFSGSAQGVVDDSCPHTFAAPNLASVLRAGGRTFAGYSEGLPAVGSTTCGVGLYARKHNPWSDFGNLPGSMSQPFTSFPSDYATLPSVSFVIPDLGDDMHDGTVAQGDSWVQTHLGAYATWAQSHNSLLVVTFDEDDHSAADQVPTIFYGGPVRPGLYAETVDHYRVLRTLVDLFRVGRPGASRTSTPIVDCWA